VKGPSSGSSSFESSLKDDWELLSGAFDELLSLPVDCSVPGVHPAKTAATTHTAKSKANILRTIFSPPFVLDISPSVAC